jgi:hypothetical protein
MTEKTPNAGKARVSLVGRGFYAQNHIYAWKLASDDADLIAVATAKRTRCALLARSSAYYASSCACSGGS